MFGQFLILMGRTFSVPERFRMFWKQYVKEMEQLGINSIGIVLLISFFIGAVICIQMKLNIQSPWMPRWVSGYTTRPDEAEHPVALDATMGERLYHARNHVAGVLVEHHVSDTGW